MSPATALTADLLPHRRSIRSPFTGVTPRPVRLIGQGLGWISNLVSVATLLLFLGLAIGPHLFGYRTETMLTGSMTPKIRVGDIVVISRIPISHLAPGNVISYQIPVEDHRVVSHRVVWVRPGPAGSTLVQTKGDANPTVDPWIAQMNGGQVWKVHFVVPLLGTAIRWLRQPMVERAVRFGFPVAAIGLALVGIWRRPLEPHPRNDPRGHRDQHARHAQEHV